MMLKKNEKRKAEKRVFKLMKIAGVMLGIYVYSYVLTQLIQISASSSISAAYDAAKVKEAVEIRALFTVDDGPALSYDSLGNMYQKKYLNRDADILDDSKTLSQTVEKVVKREQIFVVENSEEYARVLTDQGNVGYVRSAFLTDDLKYIFDSADVTKYAKANTVLHRTPAAEGESAAKLSLNAKVHITGTNDEQFWQTEYKGETVYVNKDDLMDSPKIIVQPKPVQTSSSRSSGGGYIGKWNGQRLTRSAGTIMGPSGKETYYNLKMSYVVKLMHDAGFKGEYWVREDGVKMFGNYVMVAADFSIRPKGTILPTSLGMGIVCDTGTFIYTNRYQLDIAVNW